jgi:hypothetical protein
MVGDCLPQLKEVALQPATGKMVDFLLAKEKPALAEFGAHCLV